MHASLSAFSVAVEEGVPLQLVLLYRFAVQLHTVRMSTAEENMEVESSMRHSMTHR